MQLRPYQQAAVDAVYEHLRSKETNPCVVLPTGTGKSLVLAQIAKDSVEKWNGRVLILAHVKELLEQNADKIRKLCPELKIGIYSAGLRSRDTTEQVIVAGIQSVLSGVEDRHLFRRTQEPRHHGAGHCRRNSKRVQQGLRAGCL